MNKTLLYLCIGGMLLALCISPLVFSKGHVPSGQTQLCVDGDVVNVPDALADAADSDSDSDDICILPACDFDNVFQVGAGNCTVASDDSDSDSGLSDEDGDGLCDLPNPRNDATGVTPGCTGQF